MLSSSRRSFSFRGFVFDPELGQLLQNGMRVPLRKQSADILAVLILNAGSLVTRQILRELLWPDGEVVNYEKIINNAISRLRYIFQDDPQAPTFIERVPKRGYRWIMAVDAIEHTSPSQTQSGLLPSVAAKQEENTEDLLSRKVEAEAAAIQQPLLSPPIIRSRSWCSYPRLAIAALLLLSAGIGLLFWRSRQRVVNSVPQATPSTVFQPTSLAVAPLDAIGPGASELAQSFRLDLTDALAQLPQIQVRSTHSLNLIGSKDASLPAYSTKLGLDDILFGTFKRTPQRCDLQFELVRVRDSVHLATFRYSAPISQLGSLRDAIQRDISTKLQLPSNGSNSSSGNTSNAEAYQYYLQARYQFLQQSDDGLSLAIKEYNLAIERDPGFAQAYIGLAQTYLIAALHNELVPPREALSRASDAVQHAQALGNSSAEIHSILGFIEFYRNWNLSAGIEEERQAIRLEPHTSIYHQWLALLLSNKGQYQEALSEIEQAQADDPYWSSLYVTEAYISAASMDTHRLLLAAHKVDELNPNSPTACDTMANAFWYSGRPVEAIAEWRRMAVLEHDPERVAMEDRGLAAYRKNGIKGYAQVRLAELTNSREVKRDPNDFEPEEWYMTAGDSKRAIEALRQRALSHDPYFVEEAMENFFRSVHHDPDYIALLQQTGLAPQLTNLNP